MNPVNASQLCVPVSSLAQAAAVAADVSEKKLINLDTSSQAQSHLPLILPPKLGHTWEFTHLLSRSSTQTHKQSWTHWHVFVRTHTHSPMPLCLLLKSSLTGEQQQIWWIRPKVSNWIHEPRAVYTHAATQKHEYAYHVYWHWRPYAHLWGTYFIFSVSSPISFSHTLANPHPPCWCLIRIFMY